MELGAIQSAATETWLAPACIAPLPAAAVLISTPADNIIAEASIFRIIISSINVYLVISKFIF
jgi:hypothetical protein